jgi:hypothetical protein
MKLIAESLIPKESNTMSSKSPKPRGLVAAMVLGFALTAAAEECAAERRFALFVGANQGGSQETPLRYAIHDAQRIRDVMVEFGGVAEGDAVFLANPTAEEMRQAYRDIGERASAAQGPSSFLLYYSGHAKEGALRLGESELSYAELQTWLAEEKFSFRLAVVDACDSGALTTSKGGLPVEGYEVRWITEPEVRGAVLIASSAAEEASVESDDIGASLFSHYWASGLRGAADQDQNGKVSVLEAFRFAHAKTVSRSSETRSGTQHPVYEIKATGQGDYVLTEPSAFASAIVFPPDVAGTYLVFDRRTVDIVAEVPTNLGQSTRIAVPPGSYFVKKRQADNVLIQVLDVDPGQYIEIRDENMKTVAFSEDVTKGRHSPEFSPTWKYGAPPILDTAYTLRSGEVTIGLIHPIAVGLSDGIMLSTTLLPSIVLRTPNLKARFRLIPGLSQLSLEVDYEHNLGPLLDAPEVPQSDRYRVERRSEISLGASLIGTIAFSRWFRWTLGGGAAYSSLALDVKTGSVNGVSIYDGLEALELRAQTSLLFLLTENDELLLSGKAAYAIALPESVSFWDPLAFDARFLYAHAFGFFRIGAGVILENQVNDGETPLPFVDIWFRF